MSDQSLRLFIETVEEGYREALNPAGWPWGRYCLGTHPSHEGEPILVASDGIKPNHLIIRPEASGDWRVTAVGQAPTVQIDGLEEVSFTSLLLTEPRLLRLGPSPEWSTVLMLYVAPQRLVREALPTWLQALQG